MSLFQNIQRICVQAPKQPCQGSVGGGVGQRGEPPQHAARSLVVRQRSWRQCGETDLGGDQPLLGGGGADQAAGEDPGGGCMVIDCENLCF